MSPASKTSPWRLARRNVKLAKILTRECDMVIGLPILKDHDLAGVTFAMKNMYGVVQRPYELACQRLQPGRGRPELHSRRSREGSLHHRRRHVLCL